MNLSKIQELIHKLYFQKDKKRGVQGTFIWLVEELGEVANLIKKNDLDTDKIAEELADILAWTCSLANLLNIDLESAFYTKYPSKCLKCGNNPCTCRDP
ncbi:MAG: MazG nucleotide pyrophosphohydrolase domain-containing protein [Promethearchaeota archaeon]